MGSIITETCCLFIYIFNQLNKIFGMEQEVVVVTPSIPSFSSSPLLSHRREEPFQSTDPRSGMLGQTVASPLLRLDSTVCFTSYPSHASVNVNRPVYVPHYTRQVYGIANHPSRDWELHSTTKIQDPILSDEDNKTWESCKQALSAYGFANDEQEKILGKAFGRIHSPYWGEERQIEVPKIEIINGILNYLKDLGLTDDDLSKLVKKFPEVLGCNLENEVKANVGILEKEWGIKGKTLRSLVLRNPKVLGYNVDCKGDCMAQCTRCWVRF